MSILEEKKGNAWFGKLKTHQYYPLNVSDQWPINGDALAQTERIRMHVQGQSTLHSQRQSKPSIILLLV